MSCTVCNMVMNNRIHRVSLEPKAYLLTQLRLWWWNILCFCSTHWVFRDGINYVYVSNITNIFREVKRKLSCHFTNQKVPSFLSPRLIYWHKYSKNTPKMCCPLWKLLCIFNVWTRNKYLLPPLRQAKQVMKFF